MLPVFVSEPNPLWESVLKLQFTEQLQTWHVGGGADGLHVRGRAGFMRVHKSGEPPGAATGKKTFLLNHLWKSWMWAGMSFCMFIKPTTCGRLGAFWNLDFLNMSLWVSKLLRCQSHNFRQSQLLWNSTLTQPQTPWHQNLYQGTGMQPLHKYATSSTKSITAGELRGGGASLFCVLSQTDLMSLFSSSEAKSSHEVPGSFLPSAPHLHVHESRTGWVQAH